MNEYKLNQVPEIIAAELEYFHHQNGGNSLLPTIRKDETVSELIKYSIIDGDSSASILFRPIENGNTIISIDLNDTERYGWILGVVGRSELNETTWIAAELSPKCEIFCNRFIDHIKEKGFIMESKGGRPRNEENDWAKEQVNLNNIDRDSILNRWLTLREQNNRPKLTNPKESFKKAIRKTK